MTVSIRPYHLLSTIRLILILLILANSPINLKCDTQDDVQTIARVEIDWDELPEHFNNDKLPSKVEPTKRQVCYNLIGCYEQIPIRSIRTQDPTKFKTEFLFYSQQNQVVTQVTYEKVENCLRDRCDIYPFNLGLLKSAQFQANKRTIILIGGYFSKAPSSWQTKIRELWLALEDVNVIIAAWPSANQGLYEDAAINSRPVSRHLVVLLYYLAKLNKTNLSDESFAKRIYIVGHSLGAHIAGFVAQDMAGKIGRITGLDPAGPEFDKLSDMFRLDKNDAQLVDALHTNGGAKVFFDTYYGTSLTNGHIDLYANDGRHQPGCDSDRFGCSHKRATQYYIDFLAYQLKIREQTRNKSASLELNYRLIAYSSPSYEEFRNGSTLAKNCPRTILDNNDLSSTDLNYCSIPIDYISWFEDYRDELKQKHSISFDSNKISSRKYYFYTSDDDEHRDHYLVKIQASKSDTNSHSQDCNIVFDISMLNGLNTRFTIQNYQVMVEHNEYEIIVPFSSVDAETKYELSKLDLFDSLSNDDQQDQAILIQRLSRIFPSSITINGATFVETTTKIKRPGVVGFFKDLFDIGTSVDTQNRTCEFVLKTLTVQPLRRVNRHLVAIYSDKYEKEPGVIVLNIGDESPRTTILKNTYRSFEDEKPEFFMNKVIIGPPCWAIE